MSGGPARRLHHPRLPPAGGSVALGSAASRHARVLRLAPGDDVILFDGQGYEARGAIDRIDPDAVLCVVGERRRRAATGPRVVLCQAWPKGTKLDGIVRACTELGVAQIRPFIAERSVARPDERRVGRRLDRLQKIAQEAARQSGRAEVPDVLPLAAGAAQVAERAPADAAKVALVVGCARPLDEALAVTAGEAWLLVGPEGGLSEAEVGVARRAGFVAAGLGQTILRVETAASCAVALVTHALGGLRPAAVPGAESS